MNAPILVEARANARWSLDFVHDQFGCGRRFRILNLVDDVTRECLAAIPDTSISGRRVARELTTLIERRGKPGMIVSDNGTELTSNAILDGCAAHHVAWHYIAPGKPMQNGFVESFNGRMRPSRRCTHRLPGNGRTAERDHVPQPGSRPSRHCGLGDRLQHTAPPFGPWLPDARRLRAAHDHRNRPPRGTG